MSSFETFAPLASIAIAFSTVVFTTLMMRRQVRQMEHERNALAIIEAINRLTSPEMVRVFETLQGVHERYKTDEDISHGFFGSEDDRALEMIGQYFETIACLARRGAVDPSLLVDAQGFMLRKRWATIEQFVKRWRNYNNNEFLFENFEWLARYSAWWKELPRPKRDPNYKRDQFQYKK